MFAGISSVGNTARTASEIKQEVREEAKQLKRKETADAKHLKDAIKENKAKAKSTEASVKQLKELKSLLVANGNIPPPSPYEEFPETLPPPRKRQKATPLAKPPTDLGTSVPVADRAEFRKVTATLQAYNDSTYIGPWLRGVQKFDLGPDKLRSLKLKPAKELLQEVELALANKSNSLLGDTMVRGGIDIIEKVAKSGGVDITGTGAACMNNEHWVFLLERCKIKYGIGLGSLDPVTELTLVTAQTAALMYAKNELSEPKTIALDDRVMA